MPVQRHQAGTKGAEGNVGGRFKAGPRADDNDTGDPLTVNRWAEPPARFTNSTVEERLRYSGSYGELGRREDRISVKTARRESILAMRDEHEQARQKVAGLLAKGDEDGARRVLTDALEHSSGLAHGATYRAEGTRQLVQWFNHPDSDRFESLYHSGGDECAAAAQRIDANYRHGIGKVEGLGTFSNAWTEDPMATRKMLLSQANSTRYDMNGPLLEDETIPDDLCKVTSDETIEILEACGSLCDMDRQRDAVRQLVRLEEDSYLEADSPGRLFLANAAEHDPDRFYPLMDKLNQSGVLADVAVKDPQILANLPERPAPNWRQTVKRRLAGGK